MELINIPIRNSDQSAEPIGKVGWFFMYLNSYIGDFGFARELMRIRLLTFGYNKNIIILVR